MLAISISIFLRLLICCILPELSLELPHMGWDYLIGDVFLKTYLHIYVYMQYIYDYVYLMFIYTHVFKSINLCLYILILLQHRDV